MVLKREYADLSAAQPPGWPNEIDIQPKNLA